MSEGVTKSSGDSARRDALASVLTDVIRRREQGDDSSVDEITRCHPDLMPELAAQLRALDAVGQAAVLADQKNEVAFGVADSANESHEATDDPIREWLAKSLRGYEIVKEVHRGGQGVVYEALQKATNRRVAIKILRGGPFSGLNETARFKREVNILARLNHPNIVTIHDGGVAAGCFYYVMDFIDGMHLDEYVRKRPISVNDILRLCLIVSDAVNTAHLLGIIHRDIKPANILVDQAGQPHILDLGLATADVRVDGDEKLTRSERFVGSLPWASPEQLDSSMGPLDVRTDVFSLGAVLYQLLTQRLPFEMESSPARIAEQIRNVEPKPARSVNRAINDEVETIVLKCLRKQPERRYQNAGELASDIRRYLAGEPIEAKRDSKLYVLRKHLRRHHRAVAMGVVLMVGLGVFAIYAGVQAGRFSRLAQREREAHEQAQAVNEFLQNMLASVDPRNAKTPDVTVREVLDETSQRIDNGSFDKLPGIEAAVRVTLGNTYAALGLYPVAEQNLRAALEIRRAEFGQVHASVAESLARLGEVLYFTGEYEASERHYREALALYGKLSLEGGREEAVVLSDLGVLLERMGDYDAAEDLARKALALRRNLPEVANQNISKSLNNLAVVLRKKGDFAGAEEAYREALELNRKRFGNEHVEVATNICNLGLLLAYGGTYDKAEPLLREALGIRRRLLGDEHPNVATTLNSLAGVLHELGNYDDAESMYREALRLRRNALGDEHPQVATVMCNLAKLLHDKGNAAEALPLVVESLNMYRKGLPGSAVDMEGVLYLTSQILFLLDRAADAEPYLRESIALGEKLYPADHWKIASAKSRLGASLMAMGRYVEAEPLLITAHDRVRELKGHENQTTMDCLNRIIKLYESWDQIEPGMGYAEKAGTWRAKLPHEQEGESFGP